MPDGDTRGRALNFSAGPAAYREIREEGFRPQRVGTLAGASGGPKWLVLSQLDRVVARRILPGLVAPVHTIGTSIGAWRMACLAQADPAAAIDRFERAYIEQAFSERADRAEISLRTAELLDLLLDADGVNEILGHPVLRTHVMTVRSRHLTASERPVSLALGLLAAASCNVLSRESLGLFFERVLFYDARCSGESLPPFFSVRGFPLHQVPLSPRNLRDAIIATGSIPMIMSGVRDIEGAPPGVYRDGGVIDYHIDLPQSDHQRLSLYLHFYDFLRPGWFDKRLGWRRPGPQNVDRMVLVSPSPEFVARLPGGKIPDRHDFVNFPTAERRRLWRGVVSACRQLADELEEVLETDSLAGRIVPFA